VGAPATDRVVWIILSDAMPLLATAPRHRRLARSPHLFGATQYVPCFCRLTPIRYYNTFLLSCICISFILIPLFRTDTAPPHSCALAVQQPFTVSISPQSSSFLARTLGNVSRRASSELGMPGALGPVGMGVSAVRHRNKEISFLLHASPSRYTLCCFIPGSG
jgi:hypothetical protein